MKWESPNHSKLSTYLKSKKLTFHDYKNTINLCHKKLLNKEWSEKNVRVHCTVNCIRKSGQDNVILYAKNCIARKKAQQFNEGDDII